MAPRVLGVGIIGLGEIAQVSHLPTFQNLGHLFTIAAICDISKSALEYCGTRFNIQKRFTAAPDLINCPEVDVVFVLCADQFHAEFSIQAINAGKHVFIEKPMVLTLSDADAILAAHNAHPEVVAFVAYMRRYAPAFEEAVKMVKSMDSISHARVRAVIGPNSTFVDQGGIYPQKFTDLPEGAAAEFDKRQAKIMAEVLGDRAGERKLQMGWRILNSLSSHDLSAMREMIGAPVKVLAAHMAPKGVFVNCIFQYESFNCSFETGFDSLARFDSFVEVTSPTKSVRIKFDTPYVKGLPVMVYITETVDGELRETTLRPTFADPYTIEMERLHKMITEGAPCKTTPEDARNETLLALRILEELKK